MGGKPMGLLVAGFDYGAVARDEFNDWYDTEHIPERERVPGFVNCERWVGAGEPTVSIATYDLASLEVLRSPEYRAIAGENLSPWSKRMTSRCRRICRFEAEQIRPGDARAPASGANGLLLLALNVAPEAEAEFNAWNDEEHVPNLSRVPGCLCARRFRVQRAVSDGNHRYLALYHLASPEVQESAAWKAAIETPWTHRIRPQTRDRLRLVLRRYARNP
ncbi:MAG: hypothetical protein FJY54_01980 [Betaproteobacteria bacterium]|nr:hypothetical protein [Betaproteobacteria bacterium]